MLRLIIMRFNYKVCFTAFSSLRFSRGSSEPKQARRALYIHLYSSQGRIEPYHVDQNWLGVAIKHKIARVQKDITTSLLRQQLLECGSVMGGTEVAPNKATDVFITGKRDLHSVGFFEFLSSLGWNHIR